MVRTTDLLLILAACATALALFPEIREGDDESTIAIKKVHQTWDPKAEVTWSDESFVNEQTERRTNQKRGVTVQESAFVAPNAYCDIPGYTGEYCEFPICESQNTNMPKDPSLGMKANVDMRRLSSCDASMTTVLDRNMDKIYILVESASQVRPKFRLFNKAGAEVQPIEAEPKSSSEYEAIFESQEPGLYVIQLEADRVNTECHVYVKADTDLTIVGGFVPYNSKTPTERLDFPKSNPYSGQPSSFVVHANGIRSPGKIVSVTMFQEHNVISRPQQVSVRFGCGYEFYLETFFCRDGRSSYYFRVEGVDFYGNKFRRTQGFFCAVAPPTPSGQPVSTTPSGPGPTACFNNGTLITNADGTTYCYCDGLFTGRDCSMILCMNGGRQTSDLKGCFCEKEGFIGNHCQDVKCAQRAEHGFDKNQPTLVLVVRARATLSDVMMQIANQTEAIVSAIGQNYLQNFALVLFNNDRILLSGRYKGVTEMTDVIRAAADSKDTAGGCLDSVLSSVSQGMNPAISSGSVIYVITDAVPNDESSAETIFHLNSYFRAPVYFIYIEPSATTGCSGNVFQSGYRAMADVAQMTSGQVFFVPNTETARTGELFYNHMRLTIFRTSLVSSNDLQVCGSQPNYQPISVDGSIHEFVIMAVGTGLELVISSPDGLPPNPAPTAYNLGNTFFWSLAGPQRGQWMFTLVSSAPTAACNYRMYTTQYKSGSLVAYDLFWAFSPSLNEDAPNMQPLAGTENALVAHINNYELADSSKVFAELTVTRVTRAGNEITYLSNGIWRDQCDFQLYFDKLTCLYPGEVIYLTIFVRDNVGFMIQRSGVAYCANAHPTHTPVAGCQNGGVPITLQDNSTACYCTPDYTGPQCQTLVCHNNGTLITEGGVQKCRCAAGHTGEGCETVMCNHPGEGEPFSPIGRDMAFVVEFTHKAATALLHLQNYMATLIRDFTLHHPKWIQNYILTGYNSTWSGILAKVDRENTDGLIRALNDAYNALPNLPEDGCRVRVWHALDETLNAIGPDSYVTVLHVSAPELSEMRPALAAVNYVRQKRVMVNIFYSFDGDGGFMCNATNADYELFEMLADVNGGRAYPIEQQLFSKAIQMIPNYYLSGLVYLRQLPDCDTQATHNVYFPIDLYTQSIQINIRGFNHTMAVFRANGTEFTTAYDLINDVETTGWRISELRKSCDEAWHAVGNQKCAFMDIKRTPWADSRQQCKDMGGYLFDELQSSDHKWLKENAMGGENFWIGLNDINNTGTLYWDAPDGVPPIALNSTMFTHWGQNEPDITATKRCVARILDKDGKDSSWSMQDCNKRFGRICEKHKYDQSEQPNDIIFDDLQAGKWYVQVRADKQPENYAWKYTGCEVEIRVQSSLQIFPGFALDSHADFAEPDAVSNSNRNRFITHMYGAGAGKGAVLSYANLYESKTMTMEAAATYQKRDNCAYPWVSQTWHCPNYEDKNNKFAVIHSGEDQSGFNFQRMSTGHCSPPLSACANGGMVYNGTCVCEDLWSGKTCATPKCINGGTLVTFNNTCSCPRGWAGHACQYDECLPQVPATFSIDGKSFVLIVELTVPFKAAVITLANNIQEILKNVNAASPQWFTNYILVTVDSKSYMSTASLQTMALFVAAVKALPGQIRDTGAECGAPLFGALYAVLDPDVTVSLRSPGSVIFIVTRSFANDATDNHDKFMYGLTKAKAQINYLIVDDAEKVCGMEASNENVTALGTYALASGGNMFILPSNNFAEFLKLYLPTVYTSTLLTTPTLTSMTCVDETWYAQVDMQMTSVHVTVFAADGTFSITDPSGNPVAVHIVYSVASTKLYSFQTHTTPGVYTVKMKTTAECMVQVRGDSPLTVFTGFVQPTDNDNGTHIDRVTADPVAGVSNMVALHLEGAKKGVASLTYTELINPYDGNIVISQLYRRHNCSYEYYSKPFMCPDNTFLVMVNGVDDFGQNFRREVAIAYCTKAAEGTAEKLDHQAEFVE